MGSPRLSDDSNYAGRCIIVPYRVQNISISTTNERDYGSTGGVAQASNVTATIPRMPSARTVCPLTVNRSG